MDLTEVKRIAWEEDLKEIYFNWLSRVVSFSSGDARINVYWTTGTVGVCVYPEQTFHYHCSLFELQNLMRDPRLHNGRGYSMEDACGPEEAEVIKEKQRQASLQRMTAEQEHRGSLISWSAGLNRNGDLQDIIDPGTKCIALSGYTVFSIDEDGLALWSAGLPTSLFNKVNGRQKSLPPPSYIAMGSHGRYYIQFEDGTCQWAGDLPFKEIEGLVEIVCFVP